MIEAIRNALKAVWNFIKRIFVKILNFFGNIVSFFKDPKRLQELERNKDAIAVAIKDRLSTGNYNVINCLFDKQKEELIDYMENTLILEAEELDEATKQHFGDKEMIVLR